MSHPLRGKLIAISVSDGEDLLQRGYSRVHLDNICLRLARSLLAAGSHVAYGGTFGASKLLSTLRESARYELERHPSREEGARFDAPFISFQAWPHCLSIKDDLRARDTGTIDYIKVEDIEGAPAEAKDDREAARRSSRASSRMRQWMAKEADARIVLGGKTRKFKGLMPGILEEALYHLEAGKPLYVIGEYGGASHDLAAALSRPNEEEPLPDSFNKAKRDGESEFDFLREGYATSGTVTLEHDVLRNEAETVYERLQAQVKRVRQDGGLQNGLAPHENGALMTTESESAIVRLCLTGLLAKLASGGLPHFRAE